MARQEKLSRLRGLNPYDVKKIKDEKPYSNSGAFLDTKTLRFNISQDINLPSALPVSSSLLTSELTTSITVNGLVPIGIDQTYSNQEQNFSINPFKDNIQNLSTTSFYMTGSDIVGFGQPLRNKTTIEFTLPLAAPQTLKSRSTNENPFGYYNFTSQSIDTVGILSGALDLFSGSVFINDYFTKKGFGFGPSILNALSDYQEYSSDNIYKNLGLPIKDFGFPSTSTYSGVAENLLSMKSYIREPFVLEKIQIQFQNLSCTMNQELNFIESSIALTTVFLLNQRKSENFLRDEKYKYFEFFNTVADFPTTVNAPFTNLELSYISSGSVINDLVSFARIACVKSSSTIESSITSNVELLKQNEGAFFSFTMTESEVLELVPNVPTKNEEPLYLMYFIDKSFGTNRMYSQKLSTFNGTRSNSEDYSIRNQIKQIASSERNVVETIANLNSPNAANVRYNTRPVEEIPYILFPEDNLILGFQAPIFDSSSFLDITDLTSRGYNFFVPDEKDVSTLSISGNVKITLYGSYLKMNENLDYVENHVYDNTETILNTVSTVNIGEKK